MRLGDVVSLGEGRVGLVRRVDRTTHLAHVLLHDGTLSEVPEFQDKERPGLCQVLSNPASEWPVIAAPVRNSMGPVVRVARVTLEGERVFTPFLDWIASDPTRSGGSIFFRPDLGLRFGDVLLLGHRDRSGQVRSSRLAVPQVFGTVSQRKAKSEQQRQQVEHRTRYDVLDEDDDV